MLSGKERDRLKVLHEMQRGHLRQGAAAEQLEISDREVRRLLARIAAEGDRGVVHRLRGRASNRRLPESLRSRAPKLVRRSQLPPCDPTAPAGTQQTEDRPVSWKLVVPNILRDQKPIWTFPAKVAKGEHWRPTLAFAGATAGLVALDTIDAPYFRRTSAFNQFNKTNQGTSTACSA